MKKNMQFSLLSDKDKAASRISFLRTSITHHSILYHTKDAPEISDTKYDALFQELIDLETRFPELKTADSPTQKVGGPLLPGLTPMRHSRRMYGLDNVFSADDWFAFVRRMNNAWDKLAEESSTPHSLNLSFWCDPKMDGLAMELIYEHGNLTRALTRGDGIEGEIVTDIIRTVKNVPEFLGKKAPSLLEVRGEVIMSKKGFDDLNAELKAKGGKALANPRNAAAGLVRRLDSTENKTCPLNFLAYGYGSVTLPRPWETFSDLMKYLRSYGFDTPPEGTLCASPQEAVDYYARILAVRDSLPYEIDGIVLKHNELEVQELLGFTAHAPRFSVAWKFPARRAVTILKDITIQVGRTGVLTPVAELEPIDIGGVTVNRATLHNEDEIKNRNLCIGDTVIVERAGDVIPAVIAPVLEKRPSHAIPYSFPSVCPVCGHPVHRASGESAWRCINISCLAIRKQALLHFVSNAGLDIDGFGQRWMDTLADSGRIKDPADLFTLTVSDLMKFDRMGTKLASNMVESLNASKKTATLPQLISGLGIRLVGIQTAQTLAKHFKNIEALIQSDRTALEGLPDIGAEVSASITEFFADNTNRTLLTRLKELGLDPVVEDTELPADRPLYGKRILFTGSLSIPRSTAEKKAESAGAEIASSVSKKLDILVVGEAPGSKLDKAQKLGITILDETAFQKLIEG